MKKKYTSLSLSAFTVEGTESPCDKWGPQSHTGKFHHIQDQDPEFKEWLEDLTQNYQRCCSKCKSCLPTHTHIPKELEPWMWGLTIFSFIFLKCTFWVILGTLKLVLPFFWDPILDAKKNLPPEYQFLHASIPPHMSIFAICWNKPVVLVGVWAGVAAGR